MVTWKCDLCGQETYVNPPVQTVEGEFSYYKFQNPQTGLVEDMKVLKTIDLKPRAYLVRLSIGSEVVQRDFCSSCIKDISTLAKPLFDRLCNIEGQ